MCKCCQSVLEACYWHCCEKWFCYDEGIATYEDGVPADKDRAYDNLAFWDSVAVIAGRSVVTVQPAAAETATVAEQAAVKPAAVPVEPASDVVDSGRPRRTLKERRSSAATLRLYLRDVPVIRQSSVPKFYLDTPELAAADPASRPSSVLVSPVLPNTPATHFDLQSIVQLEREQQSNRPPATPTRLALIRTKMRPGLPKKASSRSLPGSLGHM